MAIADPEDPYRDLYDYDDEKTVFTLADWYHTPSQAIIASGQVTQTRVFQVSRMPFG